VSGDILSRPAAFVVHFTHVTDPTRSSARDLSMATFVDFLGNLSSRLRRDRRTPARRRRPDYAPRVEALEGRLLLHANAVLDAEHLAVFGSRGTDGLIAGGLLPDVTPPSGVTTGVITLKSVQSGAWSDPTVWLTVNPDGSPGVNRLPQAGDNVLVSLNTTVTVDGRADLDAAGQRLALHGVRDDGTLRFDPNANTRLLVDTLVVEPNATFEMGTPTARIDPNHTARVIFADFSLGLSGDALAAYQDAQRAWDPLEFSHGLISHGTVSIDGSNVTSFIQLTTPLSANATTINLGNAAVTGWKVGDRLVISGNTADNASNVNQDEEVGIAGISGSTITLSAALRYNHSAGSVYVADMTRNATFESETPTVVAQRGHVMFMHSDHVHVDAAGFYGLGRTDKRTQINDPVLVTDTDHPGQMTTDVLQAAVNTNPDPRVFGTHRVLVPVVDAQGNNVTNLDGTVQLQVARTGLNPRGRYAVHFHRTGDANATSISDSAVVDSPGWGFVNHSSDVDMSGNVAFNVVGASFVTEAGDEVGSFDGNLALHGQGSGQGIESRQQFQDFGHQGDGFWLQGGNVSLTNNVVAGMRHSGYVFFPRGLDQAGLGVTTVDGADVDPAIANGRTDVPVGDVPLKLFSGNKVFASGDGFESWFSLLNTNVGETVVQDFQVWRVGGTAIFTPYTNHITFRNVTVTGNLANPGGTGFARNDVTRNAVYDHVNVQGFAIGINVPVNGGGNRIVGGTFNNLKNIYITTANSRDRVVSIEDGSATDPIQFLDNLTVTTRSSTGVVTVTPREQFDVYLQSNFNPREEDITRLFNRDVIQLGTVLYKGQQVYYLEQAADSVPFPTLDTTPNLPPEFVGLTNQQLFDTYGLAIGGIVAPPDAAASDPHVRGLIGSAGAYLPDLQLVSAKYTRFNPDAPSYALAYRYWNGTQYVTVRETAAAGQLRQLRPGWNLLQVTLPGSSQPRTLLVFGDDVPPTFQFGPQFPGVINQADIDNGATLVVEGDILDNSFGSMHYRQSFRLNDATHFSAVQTRADGSHYVVLSFTIHDFAGNTYLVTTELTVTDTATLIQNIGMLNLPTIAPSRTLVTLLSRA
jgi:hypothetical protein